MKMTNIKIYEIKERNDDFINKLYIIWEKSVRKTHLFLEENDIINISKYVPKALIDIQTLIIAEDKDSIGFIGIENKKIEMLFLDPNYIGMGIGKKLVEHVIKNYDVKEVSVNEQNPNAYNFYEKLGFKVYSRDEYDEQGNPFPILNMKLK